MEESIKRRNEAIALFMKHKANPIKVNKYQYHSSWDWLMPVCQKINSKESQILLESNGVKDSIHPYMKAMKPIKEGVIRFDIEKTYDGVVEFIKWYNFNKTV